jgi:RNA polymerase sigma-70 factor (ECF subfamily)
VQETFLRAWRNVRTLEPGANFRAWLYRIATNAAIDMTRKRSRQVSRMTSFAEVPWLQPYPDTLLDEIAPDDHQPDVIAVDRETIELAFLAALQVLPPRQRAALIARDVLGWPANDAADLLDTSVAATNSALQRARATMQQHLPERRSEWSTRAVSDEERAMLDRFIDAHNRCDAKAALAVAGADIRITMPPNPFVYEGRDGIAPLLERAFGVEREGDWQLLPTQVNRMPTAASYLRRPGDSLYRPFKLDVLRVRGGEIAEITTFGPQLFPDLRLPPSL